VLFRLPADIGPTIIFALQIIATVTAIRSAVAWLRREHTQNCEAGDHFMVRGQGRGQSPVAGQARRAVRTHSDASGSLASSSLAIPLLGAESWGQVEQGPERMAPLAVLPRPSRQAIPAPRESGATQGPSH